MTHDFIVSLKILSCCDTSDARRTVAPLAFASFARPSRGQPSPNSQRNDRLSSLFVWPPRISPSHNGHDGIPCCNLQGMFVLDDKVTWNAVGFLSGAWVKMPRTIFSPSSARPSPSDRIPVAILYLQSSRARNWTRIFLTKVIFPSFSF
jgi:hypothetical protein